MSPTNKITLITLLLLAPAIAYAIGRAHAHPSPPPAPPSAPTPQAPENRLDTPHPTMPNMPLDAYLYQALTDAPRNTHLYRNAHEIYFNIEFLGCTQFGTTYVIRTGTLTPQEFNNLRARIILIWYDLQHPEPPCDTATLFHLQDRNDLLPGTYKDNPSLLPAQATNTITLKSSTLP